MNSNTKPMYTQNLRWDVPIGLASVSGYIQCACIQLVTVASILYYYIIDLFAISQFHTKSEESNVNHPFHFIPSFVSEKQSQAEH